MIVQTTSLSKRFWRVDALRDLNLSVAEGSAYALIGANGAGKTTALKILMNLVAPSAGNASVLGIDSRKLSHAELARIGYVSENQLLPARLTVAEYFAYLRRFYRSWDRTLERDLCTKLQLPADRRIGALSHGMRMKMALACALPFKPELLILDEPLGGLDPLARDELMEGVLNQAGEMTILISSQELSEIEHVLTHVGFIDAGRLLFQCSMAELHERVRRVRVVVEPGTTLPTRLCDDWLDVDVSGNLLSFVETRYSEDSFGARVRAYVPGTMRVESEALPLRAIFIALARDARERSGDPARAVQ